MRHRIGVLALILSLSANVSAVTIVDVLGQVVDHEGKPVAGVRVADDWTTDDSARLKPNHPALTDADGRFSLKVDIDGEDIVVMAIDSTDGFGGLAIVAMDDKGGPIRIELKPLVGVRGKFTCEESGKSPNGIVVTMSLAAGNLRVAAYEAGTATFVMKLPAGQYRLGGIQSYCHINFDRKVTLVAGHDLDLGAIDLKLTPLARFAGKEPPALHVTDARGVPKDVRLTDFKGKWVVLDFWAYWCGPCVGQGLPVWMEFVEEHAADRDKFVILTIHDTEATNFATLDEKLKPIVRRQWRGQSLPFPILLDSTGKTMKDYGITSLPTVVLLDPQGRVFDTFGEAGMFVEEYLASKLPPVLIANQIPRALDRDLAFGISETDTIEGLMSVYNIVGRIKIHLDLDELKAVGISENTRVPLNLGAQLTLRAWLNLTLDSFGLTYVADGDGLKVVRRTPENIGLSRPSPRQIQDNALVAEALQSKVSFDFQSVSLDRVIAELEAKTEETFVLDPVARRAGTIKVETKATGSAVDEPLATALTRLLAPLNMTYVIRDEAVVLTTAP